MNSDLFTPDRPLPEKMYYKSAANRLFKIGLTLRTRHKWKRSFIHHPLLISIVHILYITKTINNLVSKDRQVFIYFGKFSHFMGLSFHFDCVTIIFFLNVFVSQVYYFISYINDVEPTFLRVFEMMSGHIPPREVGLTDLTQVTKLVRQTKLLFTMLELVRKVSVPVFGMPMVLFPYLQFCTRFETLVFGIPNSLHFCLSCYYCGINFYQFVYFYLICYYLKIKIKNVNKAIVEQTNKRQFNNITKMVRQLNSIYVEMDEYNQTYFARFLLSFWVTLGSVFVLLLFGAVFQDVNLVYKIVFYYNSALFAVCIALVIFTPSSLNTEANKSYKILNSFLSNNYKNYNWRKMTSITTKYKVNTLIARVSSKNIGFTCGKLFTINYFRSYELIAFICCLFMKIYETSTKADQEITQLLPI